MQGSIRHCGRVRASEFDVLFERDVVDVVASVGFEPWGKSLWFSTGGMRAAVLRTELRSQWPFRLTLVVGHDCLRDFEDRCPAPRSRNVSEYPIKVRPSDADALLGDWHYQPWNQGRCPADELSDEQVESQLASIGRVLTAAFPAIVNVLTPERMLDEIGRHGERAWCERRWMSDYQAAT